MPGPAASLPSHWQLLIDHGSFTGRGRIVGRSQPWGSHLEYCFNVSEVDPASGIPSEASAAGYEQPVFYWPDALNPLPRPPSGSPHRPRPPDTTIGTFETVAAASFNVVAARDPADLLGFSRRLLDLGFNSSTDHVEMQVVGLEDSPFPPNTAFNQGKPGNVTTTGSGTGGTVVGNGGQFFPGIHDDGREKLVGRLASAPLPSGYPLLFVAGVDRGQSCPIGFPAFANILFSDYSSVAAESAYLSTRIADIRVDGRIDRGNTAALSSALRAVSCLGDGLLGGAPSSVAINGGISPDNVLSGRGQFTEQCFLPTGALSFQLDNDAASICYFSATGGGPVSAGNGILDIHFAGQDRAGLGHVGGHLDLRAPWYFHPGFESNYLRPSPFDGPPKHHGAYIPPNNTSGVYTVTELRFDPEETHIGVGPNFSQKQHFGLHKWETLIPLFMPPDPPPPLPPEDGDPPPPPEPLPPDPFPPPGVPGGKGGIKPKPVPPAPRPEDEDTFGGVGLIPGGSVLTRLPGKPQSIGDEIPIDDILIPTNPEDPPPSPPSPETDEQLRRRLSWKRDECTEKIQVDQLANIRTYLRTWNWLGSPGVVFTPMPLDGSADHTFTRRPDKAQVKEITSLAPSALLLPFGTQNGAVITAGRLPCDNHLFAAGATTGGIALYPPTKGLDRRIRSRGTTPETHLCLVSTDADPAVFLSFGSPTQAGSAPGKVINSWHIGRSGSSAAFLSYWKVGATGVRGASPTFQFGIDGWYFRGSSATTLFVNAQGNATPRVEFRTFGGTHASPTASSGVGGAMSLHGYIRDSANAEVLAGQINIEMSSVTAGAVTSVMNLYVKDSGAQKGLIILNSGNLKHGDQAGAKMLTHSATSLTTDRTATYPDASITVAGTNLDNNFSTKQTFQNEVEIDGDFNHDGTNFGALGADPAPQQAAIPDPTGGAVVDDEARAAIGLIIDVLETFGFTDLA